MPLIRTYAKQAHAVPNGYQSPRGPFPPELYITPRAEYELDYGDSLHEALDDVRYFRCKLCAEILAEQERDAHECEEEEY